MKLNRNYAGIPYLYRAKGAVSTVMEVVMKEEVDGEMLQVAVNFTVSRHPYFKSSLQERQGDYYIAENEMPFEVKETKELRSLGSKELNFHLMDITYSGKKIFVAFHHALCDGLGARRFVETLVCYYCEFKYGVNIENGDGTLPKPGDILDPFAYGMYPMEDVPMPETIKDGYALPEVPETMDGDTDYRYEFTLNNDSLMAYSKKIGASPAIVVALIVSKAIHTVHPDADKPVLCSMASNLREGLHAENTFKNCVNSINLPYHPNASFEEQAAEYKQIIKAHKEENYVKRCANGMVYLFQRLDALDTLEAKKAAMAMFDNIRINSYSLSYTGRLDLTECERFIDSMHLYSGGNNGLFVNMMSVGNTTTIDILQSFTDESYVNTIKELLQEAEIAYTVSDCITFTTPRDGIADTPAVASVRERINLKQYIRSLSN